MGLSVAQLEELVNEGPVSVAINSNGWETYSSGIFACSDFNWPNHAVLIVGYTDQYWTIKNQWGSSWGEGGFMRITKDMF